MYFFLDISNSTLFSGNMYVTIVLAMIHQKREKIAKNQKVFGS